MAQHFSIPLAFEYRPQKLRWQRSRFQIAGRLSDFKPALVKFAGTEIPMPMLGTGIHEPDEALIRLTDDLETSPWKTGVKELLFRASPGELSMCFETATEFERSGEGVPESLSEVLLCFNHECVNERVGDPWLMRQEFFKLPQTNDALLRFANRWGAWNFGALSVHTSRFSLNEFEKPESRSWIECLSPFLVWREQKRLKAAMLAPPEVWLSDNAALGFTTNRERFPYLGVKAHTCLRAIEITITLDHLRNVRSGICARPDCNNIFIVESNHGKLYCDQYCAHLVSVRRGRAVGKAAKLKSTKKEIG